MISTALLAVILLATPISFKEPVKITAEQASFLRNEAKKLRRASSSMISIRRESGGVFRGVWLTTRWRWRR